MKKLSLYLLLVFAAWNFQACDTKKSEDSTEQAEEANEQKADALEDANRDQAADALEDDSEFAVKAASGGMMEVELGTLAQQKAQNARVKEFARMMVDDHTKANNELKALAAQKNMTLPTTMGNDHQKHVDDLRSKSGADFDRAYMDLMVEDHDEDIELFEKMSNNAKDADVKAFAAKTLPTLRKHHESAKSIKDGMKNS
ncbi:hypothetical protein GCM10023189_22070 [Nibrella saemangeumensis]|uniref:DUF4142 domain-containing protein n=1 Tax=Nibrella saemangeumensis TaxID=1084526 RepID=A0ABP8MTW2_9BACT